MGTLAEGIDAALADLRPSFAADDFDITLESLADTGDVVVAIEARPGACRDCLMPEPMLSQVIAAAVRRHAPAAGTVSVITRGFENSDLA